MGTTCVFFSVSLILRELNCCTCNAGPVLSTSVTFFSWDPTTIAADLSTFSPGSTSLNTDLALADRALSSPISNSWLWRCHMHINMNRCTYINSKYILSMKAANDTGITLAAVKLLKAFVYSCQAFWWNKYAYCFLTASYCWLRWAASALKARAVIFARQNSSSICGIVKSPVMIPSTRLMTTSSSMPENKCWITNEKKHC